MTLRLTCGLAIAALLRNKMRSLLTTLGIVIGVAAVVTMQSMGEGATAYVGQAISGLGSNLLIAVPGATRGMGPMSLGVPLFSSADVEVLRRDARDANDIAAVTNRMLRLVVGANNHTANVGGVTPGLFAIRTWTASTGRLLNEQDERQAALVCVIGQTVADALFPGISPLGKEMRVHDVSCRVVGVLAEKGAAAFGMDQDDLVYMPFSTFSRRIAGDDAVAMIMVSSRSPDRIDSLQEQMTSILRRQRHILPGDDDDFAVRDPRELQALLETVTGVLTTLLAGVAAISLLVGGIGIMNIMLVSVTERTREIGIRLAVGARSSDILTQFLVEAVILSAAGGLIGIGVGLGAGAVAAGAIEVPFVVPASAIPLAFAVALAVGIVFGVFPARKASRLSPLSALRFE